MTNWYPSMLNFDLCSGSMSGAMNIQWNAGIEDFAARQMMFNVPIFNFNGFMPYTNPVSFTNNHLLNPMYTLGQMDWQNRTQGGPGFFNADGQFQLPFSTNPFGGNMFNTPGFPTFGTPGAGKTEKEPETAEEIGYKRKYNSLLSLAKQLVAVNNADCKLSQADKDILNAAIRNNTKGNNEAKYKALKAEFDKVDKAQIKAILVNSESIAINSDKTNKEESFKNQLATAGYELENDTDALLSELKIALGKASSGADMDSVAAIGKTQFKQDAIVLDLISSWNNENKNNRLPKAIMDAYNKISDASYKSTFRSEVVEPLGTGLIAKAKSLKSVGDSASQEKLAKAIKAVEDGLAAQNLPSDLATKLDNLYVLTRYAAIAQVRKEVVEHYGDVAPEIFNDELFAEETEADLKAEGFTETQIKAGEIKADGKGGAATKVDTSIDEKPATEQVAKLVADGTVKEVKVGETTYYQEVKKTGGRDYQRIFFVNTNGELCERQNVYIGADGKAYYVAGKGEADDKNVKVKASEIQAAEETKTEKEKAEENKTTVSNATAEVNGQRVWSLLTQWNTNNTEVKEINECLKTIDKTNVMSFLKGVYGTKSSKGCEGIMEKLDDDAHNKENGTRIISMDTKKAIIKAVIDYAQEAIGEEDTDLIKLKDFYKKYTTGDLKTEEDFSKAYKTWLGCTTLSYSEVIDDCIFNLFKKISA